MTTTPEPPAPPAVLPATEPPPLPVDVPAVAAVVSAATLPPVP